MPPEPRALRILVVASRLPLASETFVRAQCAALVRAGQEVDILSLSQGDGAWSAGDLDAELPARTRCAHLEQPAARRVALAPLRAAGFARHGWRAALRTIDPRLGWRARSGQLAAVAHALAAPRRVDLVLAQFGPAGLVALSLRRAGLVEGPIATAFYGFDLTRALRDAPNLYRGLYDEAALLLPNSEHLAGVLRANGAPSSKTVVHRLGIDLARFPAVDRRARPAAPTALAVGRFVEKKGFEHAIRALAAAGDASAFRLRLIGDGPLRPRLEQVARELGVTDRVEFAGWRTHEEVACAMADADLLLAPSVVARDGDMEGLPLVVIEALATGMPVIGSRHGGIPELVSDGVNGVLCDERDEGALAAALVRLSDPETRSALGRNARATVERDFSADELASRLVAMARALR
ncbi:MAG: glycosyltransferase [Phycisphaerales bacterium]